MEGEPLLCHKDPVFNKDKEKDEMNSCNLETVMMER